MAENRELALVLKLVADQFQSELKKSGGALGEFNKFISDWKVQLTAAGGALFAVAKATANFGEEALKGAQRTGATVEAYTALAYSARLADMDQQQLSVGLKALSVNMVEAATRTGDGEMLFRRLGISATDSSGKMRSVKDVLFDVADAFQKHADGAGKTEASVKLFAKAWQEFLPWMNQGSQAIRAQNDDAKQLGVTMSDQNARAAAQFNEEIKRLNAAVKGLSNDIGTGLIPFLTHSMQLITDMIPKARELGDELATFSITMSDRFAKTRQGQMSMDIMTWLGLGHRKGEERTPREQFWSDLLRVPAPGSGEPTTSGEVFGPPGPKGEIPLLADQEKLGKALLEIYLANNRAIDIRNKLVAEEATVEERTYRHMLDFKDREKQNEKDRQERLGKAIVEQTGLQVRIRDEALAKERDGLAQNAQAWLDYHAQVGGSTQLRYDKDLALLQANLSKQLDLTQSETARLLVAWQEHENEVAEAILAKTTLTATQRETIELQALTKIAQANEKASDDVFAGWSAGLRRYVQDQQSMFGLGADMARRFFQTMEQFSQRFFFDAMEGKINGTKQLFASLLNFAQQITSQIAGQLLMRQIGGAITGSGGGTLLSALFGGSTLEGAAGASRAAARGAENPALFGPGFATGGSFRVPGSGGTDTMPVGFWATPGETVDIRTPGQQSGGGGVTVIVNNYGNQDVQTSSSRGSDGKQTIYVTVREIVKGLVQGGEMDGPMGRRFGVNPRPATR